MPAVGCAAIPTNDDMILESDHDFTVSGFSITPDTSITFSGSLDFSLTITDNDGTL